MLKVKNLAGSIVPAAEYRGYGNEVKVEDGRAAEHASISRWLFCFVNYDWSKRLFSVLLLLSFRSISVLF